MVAISALQDDWRIKLQTHKFNILFSISLEDLSYIQFRSALALQDAPNPSLALMAAGATDQVDTKLKEINANVAEDQEAGFKNLQTEIEKLKEEKPDESAWRVSLNKKKAELQQKSKDAIEKSFTDAEEYISKLPKEQRAPAATVFEKGADLVSKAAEFVFGKIKEVISAIADFLRGIWDKVTLAFNSVKDFIFNTVGLIKGSFSALQAPEPTSESGVFEGSIIWNRPIPLVHAATCIETVCQTLDLVVDNSHGPKPDYKIISQSTNISDGKGVGNVLFKVTTHASELGKLFSGLVEKVSSGSKITWTIRGESNILPPASNSKSFSPKLMAAV